jgi:hypothetical protein
MPLSVASVASVASIRTTIPPPPVVVMVPLPCQIAVAVAVMGVGADRFVAVSTLMIGISDIGWIF